MSEVFTIYLAPYIIIFNFYELTINYVLYIFKIINLIIKCKSIHIYIFTFYILKYIEFFKKKERN